MGMHKRSPLPMNQLPQHTLWPRRLLWEGRIEERNRGPDEVLREFDREKWAEINGLLSAKSDLTLLELEKRELGHIEEVAFESGEFFLDSGLGQQQAHVGRYADILGPVAKGAAGIVELGAGYGSKILALASRPEFSDLDLFAGEFTPMGRSAIRELARRDGTHISVGVCDFFEPSIGDFGVPPDSIIFTSYAMMYVPKLPTNVVDVIASLEPRVVVHFEPCFEHYTPDTLHGLLCRKYIEVNDYNRDLVTVLRSAQSARRVEIVREDRVVFGMNALMPVSVVAWRPTN